MEHQFASCIVIVETADVPLMLPAMRPHAVREEVVSHLLHPCNAGCALTCQ